jgi:hypothetical protein
VLAEPELTRVFFRIDMAHLVLCSIPMEFRINLVRPQGARGVRGGG